MEVTLNKYVYNIYKNWNDLPTPIRNTGSLSIFKQQLKTHLSTLLDYLEKKKKIFHFFKIFIFLSFPC